MHDHEKSDRPVLLVKPPNKPGDPGAEVVEGRGLPEGNTAGETRPGRTAQGASVSPLLCNVYLHYVFDLWADQWRRRNARGDVVLVRFHPRVAHDVARVGEPAGVAELGDDRDRGQIADAVELARERASARAPGCLRAICRSS
jgi:hypothetical protein